MPRTSSDSKLNPHLHVAFRDGVFREDGEAVAFHALPHLRTREVADGSSGSANASRKWLRRRNLPPDDASGIEDAAASDGGVAALSTSTASGRSPRARPPRPEWRRGMLPLAGTALTHEKPLCAVLDGFTLHAASDAARRAGASTRKDASRSSNTSFARRPRRSASPTAPTASYASRSSDRLALAETQTMAVPAIVPVWTKKPNDPA